MNKTGRSFAKPLVNLRVGCLPAALSLRIDRAIPDMYPKAYRWAPEMEQIADFLGDDLAAREIFHAMAALCRHFATDQAGDRAEIGLLDKFVTKLSKTE